ncbi:MAG: UDP-N-acetylglucosamine 2-epimerase, partial [Bacteroidetes bacterium]|nr:UDP-N-acetylglucosamine 2-epimerase [Bacteroidota bacterium]
MGKQILLVVQHPVTTETNDAEIQMRETMEALVELGKQTVLVYPNSDAGSYTMIRIIKEYEHLPFLHTFVNIPHRMYLSLMKVASVMIGNSSGGIIEAPSFRLPVINIGSRQNGRQRANNVIDVDYKREEIKEAVFKALGKEFQQQVATCLNPYGEGNTGPKAAQILADIKLDPRLL